VIAYRVEIWCDRCDTGRGRRLSTVHSDSHVLPRLGRNLETIRVSEGWTKRGRKHYCPTCKPKSRPEGKGDGRG
jgi:hypothetical protein